MNNVLKYFNEERIQCAIGIIIGLASVATAIYLLYRFKNPLYNGIAYSLIVVSLFLLTICVGVVIRTPKDIERVGQMVQQDISKIGTEEIPRMEKVMKNFSLVIWLEICCFILGGAIWMLAPSTSQWKGVGMGLLIQSAMLFVFDFIAQNRGKIYLEHLRTLN